MKMIMVLIAALSFPLIASANYTCGTGATSVTVGPDGIVEYSAAVGLKSVYICRVDATANGVDADTCKAIYQMLLAARISGGQPVFDFNDSLTCTTHP